MMIFSSSIFFCLVVIGFVFGRPVEENQNEDLPFRKAELTLKRYFYLMNSDTDHLVHAILHILINNPTIYPYVPTRALEIAFKNVAEKLGPTDLDVLVRPMLIQVEHNFQNHSKQIDSKFRLDEDIKEDIEDALDKFLDQYEHK